MLLNRFQNRMNQVSLVNGILVKSKDTQSTQPANEWMRNSLLSLTNEVNNKFHMHTLCEQDGQERSAQLSTESIFFPKFFFFFGWLEMEAISKRYMLMSYDTNSIAFSRRNSLDTLLDADFSISAVLI